MKLWKLIIGILAMAVMVGGMALIGGPSEALAEVTRPAGMTTRGTFKPTVTITVQAPRRGDEKTRGGYVIVAWTWHKNRASSASSSWEPTRNFTITVIKGRTKRDRTVVANLGSANNSFTDGGGYNRTWRIPADFATGDDFMVKVKHTSGSAGMAGFFTIE